MQVSYSVRTQIQEKSNIWKNKKGNRKNFDDMASDQITMKEFIDPFAVEEKSSKKKGLWK